MKLENTVDLEKGNHCGVYVLLEFNNEENLDEKEEQMQMEDDL